MKKNTALPWIVFFGALALGVLLHFLHGWLPVPVTALISPVKESIWEHLKILFYPLLLSAFILSRGNSALRSVRLLARGADAISVREKAEACAEGAAKLGQ